MAIRYSRDYDRILDDLANALATVPQFYEAFEMDSSDWDSLSKDERDVCVRTLADDLFYVLGSEPSTDVGLGKAEYDASHGRIKIFAGSGLVHVVSLRE
jgi:hypothetical protein